MNKLKYLPLLFFLFFVSGIQAQTNEYLIKAGFIEKFANFTDWPNHNAEYFEIAILGESPFNKELESLYGERYIKEKPVNIRYINALNQINNCNVLFICKSESSQLTSILNYTHAKPILTISETNGFAKKGVHINFYETRQGTIHFEINAKKVKTSGLSIDALLLDYANIVN